MNPKELDKKYEDLNVTENDFFTNNLRVQEHHFKDSLNQLFKPVNKTRWDMTPPTVNAYYSPTKLVPTYFVAGAYNRRFINKGHYR